MTHNVWIPADEIKMEVLKWNKNQKKLVDENGDKKNEGKEKYDWLKLGKFKKKKKNDQIEIYLYERNEGKNGIWMDENKVQRSPAEIGQD